MFKDPKILICEDDPEIQELLKSYLETKCSFDVSFCSHGEEFIEKLSKFFSVLLVDIKLPGMNGVDVLKVVRQKHPQTPVIMMTAYSSEDIVIQCMREGAYNYIKKPFNLSALKATILEAHSEYRQRHNIIDQNRVSNLDTNNLQVKKLHNDIEKLAKKNISILLQGETGTGKEHYAKMIHRLRDSNAPFIAVNCPAIPKDLAESEIFGHEKGAFTGADQLRKGKLEVSDGGVLFLDEIADLDFSIQNKLLRCLQERSFCRVGGTQEIKFDSLIVSATSKNLHELIKEQKFREDLYYRIADVELNIVSLRNRKEDLDTLVKYFCNEYALENQERIKSFSESALKALRDYSWPGNLRELRSCIRKLCILCDSDFIQVEDLPYFLEERSSIMSKKEEVKDRPESQIVDRLADSKGTINKLMTSDLKTQEKEIIEKVLQESRYNMTVAAKKLGIGRSTLYRKVKKYNLLSENVSN